MNEALPRLFVKVVLPLLPVVGGGNFTQICDLTFADAVRNDGYISEERRKEAEILCRTYLAFHLPARLPARSQDYS